MKIKIYKEFNSELEIYWNIIEKSSNYFIFQKFDWLKTWQRYIGNQSYKISPHIIVLFDDNFSPKIIFPLGTHHKLGVKIFTFLGGNQSDYNYPLIDREWINNQKLVMNAWEVISNHFPNFDVLHFEKFPENILNDFNPFLKILNFRIHDTAYFSKIPKTIEDFEKKLRSKVRTDTNRQLRRLNALSGVLKIDLNNILTDDKVGINEMIKQKRKKYALTNVPDIFKDNNVKSFYLNLHKNLTGNASVHFSVLKFDHHFLSTHWGAIHNGRFYFLMPSYESGKFAVYSPGKILLYNLMTNAIKNKLEIFDFTIGGEQYKKDWCDNKIDLYEYLKVKSFKGFVYVIMIKLKRIIRNNSFIFNITKKIYGLISYSKWK